MTTIDNKEFVDRLVNELTHENTYIFAEPDVIIHFNKILTGGQYQINIYLKDRVIVCHFYRHSLFIGVKQFNRRNWCSIFNELTKHHVIVRYLCILINELQIQFNVACRLKGDIYFWELLDKN